MELSRLKKVVAGMSAAAIMFTQVSSVFAAYADVSAGVWFEEAVQSFVDAGYLDATQPNFRPVDTANRAEFVKLIVELNGGILSSPPAVPSYDDVKASAWYYNYMEEAGKEGWVKGDGNCYGTHPCYARPSANISRAEAATLIVRAFNLESTADAPTFVDNPAGQWYTQAIQIAADHCVLQGDSTTGRVRPTDNMNRAEMVVMLNRVDQGLVYGEDCSAGTPNASTPSISTVSAVSSTKVEVTFNVAVDEAAAKTLANYVFSPAATVASVTVVGEKSVEVVVSEGLTAGKEYTLTVSNMKTADGDTFSDSEKFNGYSTLPQGNGTLEVSVSSTNPVGDTLPQGAHQVTFLSLDLTASCDDSVTLENITVLHEGFGAKADITGVYATIDGGRVTRERSIDSSDQTASVRFISALVIPACKTVTVDLVGDISATASPSAEHNFAVELQSDFLSNAKSVTGNFPMRGNTFKVGAVDSGQITVAYRTVSPDQVEVGDKGVVVGRFEVSTDSVEDQTLYTMTLHQNGTVSDGDITNIKVRRTDGTVLTNVAAEFKNKYATVTFNPPFTVLEGDKITLEVVADVVGGAASTSQIDIDETSDVFAVGSLYGYGVNGQLYGSAVILSGTATSVTVEAGQFTIEINGPAQQSYTRDQNDAVLGNVVFTTGGDTVNVKELYVAVQAQTVTGAALITGRSSTSYDEVEEVLENVTMRNATTGTSLEGTPLGDASTDKGTTGLGATTAAYQIYRFDDFTVNGKETWQIKADFKDNSAGNHPLNGDQFKVQICGEPTQIGSAANTVYCDFGGLLANQTTANSYQMDIEGLSTGDKVEDVRPRGTISGNAHRIADASLQVSVQALSTTETAVKNAKNVRLLRFNARAGEAKNILLTKFIFESAAGTNTIKNGVNYALWVDTDGDGTVDTILDSGKSSVSSAVTFDTITNGGFVVNKEQTVTFEVHSDIAGSLQTTASLQLRFATGSTFIEAETVDRGSSLSGLNVNGTIILSAASADMTVTTTPSTLFSLVNQGTLYVTKDTTPVRNHQLLAGTLGDTILRLNFRAENEPIDVTNLQLTSSGSTAASIERLELYKEGATSYFAIATTNSCGTDDVPSFNPNGYSTSIATFCASMQTQQLVVPKGGEVKVLVKPRLKNDDAGATSNQLIALFIDPDDAMNNSTGTGAVRARGADSSNNLNGNDLGSDGEVLIGSSVLATANAIISSNTHRSVLAKITAITNANTDPNGTNVSAGVKEIGKFKISAAANTNSKNGLNKVTLSGVYFNVTATNVAIGSGSFYMYNSANQNVTKSCSAYTTGGTAMPNVLSGSFIVLCDFRTTTSNVQTQIDQGTDSTFVLRAEITNPDVVAANTSNLLVSIQDFSSDTKQSFAYNNSHFVWDDQDNGGSEGFTWVEYPETVISSTSYQS
ncbi:MAG: S-layer homology domain-containing protein [Candidatus Peribacteraceae bacterium]|jgi:hypothetical protein